MPELEDPMSEEEAAPYAEAFAYDEVADLFTLDDPA